MGGLSLKFEPELRGEYAEFPERLTRHRICENRVVGDTDWTACERGAIERRVKRREGSGEGAVIVVVLVVLVERGRLEKKNVNLDWRIERAVTARARVWAIVQLQRTKKKWLLMGDREILYQGFGYLPFFSMFLFYFILSFRLGLVLGSGPGPEIERLFLRAVLFLYFCPFFFFFFFWHSIYKLFFLTFCK